MLDLLNPLLTSINRNYYEDQTNLDSVCRKYDNPCGPTLSRAEFCTTMGCFLNLRHHTRNQLLATCDLLMEQMTEQVVRLSRESFARGEASERARILKRQPCEVCDTQRSQAHHWHGYDADHRLDVQWLCQAHHLEAEKHDQRQAA